MRRNETPGRIVTNFCRGVGVHDVITSANFYDSLMGFERGGKSNFGFLYWLASSPLQHSRTTVRVRDHGIHGSAGTVLTAITISYGKWRNSTPRRIKTPSLVEMKLRTYDYVREMCPQIYFCKNSCSGGFWRKWWNIASQFFYASTFFSR